MRFRKIYLPQAGERDVFNPLIGSFFDEPGIFVNGFEPNQYLKEFSQAAEDMRNESHVRNAIGKVELIMSSIIKNFPEGKKTNFCPCFRGQYPCAIALLLSF